MILVISMHNLRPSWNIDGFHWAALAIITLVVPLMVLNLKMSSCVLIWFEPPLAMTGIFKFSATFLIISACTLCCGRSCLVLPWTAMALIPIASNSLTKLIVLSMSGNIRILQVIGMDSPVTSAVRTFFAFSALLSRAMPMPPFTENSFGHPILMSIPATSFSTLQRKYRHFDEIRSNAKYEQQKLPTFLLATLVPQMMFPFVKRLFAVLPHMYEKQLFHQFRLQNRPFLKCLQLVRVNA